MMRNFSKIFLQKQKLILQTAFLSLLCARLRLNGQCLLSPWVYLLSCQGRGEDSRARVNTQYERLSARHTYFFQLGYDLWAPIAMGLRVSDPSYFIVVMFLMRGSILVAEEAQNSCLEKSTHSQ